MGSRPLWRDADYLLLVSGEGISTLGSQVSMVAVPVLVLALTGSATQAGVIGALESAPYFLLALPAGALVDRWNRRAVIVVCDGARALVLLSVPIVFLLGELTIAQLYVIAFLSGSAYVFSDVAALSSMTSIVPRSRLTQAASTSNMVRTTAGLVGPGLGGLLITIGRSRVSGAVLAVLFDAITFIASVASVLLIRRPMQGPRTTGSRQSLSAGIREGVTYLWRHRLIRTVAIVSGVLNLVFSPVYLALIVLVDDQGGSAVQIGLVFSTGAVGGLLGALAVPWLARRVRTGTMLVGPTVAWAIAASLLPLSASPTMTAVCWGLVTFLSPMYDITQMSYRLAVIPEELQGRVNSAFRFLAWGLRPIGLAAGGAAVGAFGARTVLAGLAAALTVVAVAVACSSLRTVSIDESDS